MKYKVSKQATNSTLKLFSTKALKLKHTCETNYIMVCVLLELHQLLQQ